MQNGTKNAKTVHRKNIKRCFTHNKVNKAKRHKFLTLHSSKDPEFNNKPLMREQNKLVLPWISQIQLQKFILRIFLAQDCIKPLKKSIKSGTIIN